jgi:hypothetical protein
LQTYIKWLSIFRARKTIGWLNHNLPCTSTCTCITPESSCPADFTSARKDSTKIRKSLPGTRVLRIGFSTILHIYHVRVLLKITAFPLFFSVCASLIHEVRPRRSCQEWLQQESHVRRTWNKMYHQGTISTEKMAINFRFFGGQLWRGKVTRAVKVQWKNWV